MEALSGKLIKQAMSCYNDIFDIHIYKTLDSTNREAKDAAAHDGREGLVIMAESQSNGIGRQGRSFFSPYGTGIYMSIVLRPDIFNSVPGYITTAAAVAAARAIEDTCSVKADIKWVNDIFVNGKKVCGILTEGAFDTVKGGLKYAVLGIGINVEIPKEGFPEEIQNIAAAVLTEDGRERGLRNRLAGKVLEYFWDYYLHLTEKFFYEGYRSRSFLIGQRVELLSDKGKRCGDVLDVDTEFALVVRMEDGCVCHLSSGEVRAKMIN